MSHFKQRIKYCSFLRRPLSQECPSFKGMCCQFVMLGEVV